MNAFVRRTSDDSVPAYVVSFGQKMFTRELLLQMYTHMLHTSIKEIERNIIVD
jgi:hypothetical protein